MLGSVPTAPKTLDAYRPVIGDERTEEIRALAARLRGARVLHVNATAFGGGVAEILATLVPLMNDLGLVADWQVIRGADEFFNVTKAMHNSMQGMYYDWTPAMRDIWLNYNRMNADLFDESYDYVVIHDPQPAAIPSFIEERTGRRDGKWIWRCHIDLTDAQAQVWDILRPHVERYDGAIFTLPAYVKDDLRGPEVFCVPPAIDPLSPKNVDLPPGTVDEILSRYGVDPGRPMVTQISRFDPWKDPLGVIDVYRTAKREFPDLQLVMIASMASDDPEGWSWYERTVRHAGEDFDIHILSNLNGVGNVEVNAFQRAARVVIQKSLREGFGLVVSEALWKGRPVVGGNVGGIPLQIVNGKTGFLVNTADECAEKLLLLLRGQIEADRMGAAGVEFVRDNFLTTRYLRDYLNIFCRLSGLLPEPPASRAQSQRSRR
ncbi:MAG TPA: glycosyltransferase [Dehalococcoidia bacterium]|nr:glycosyltransferase [Dehalococcoidia bacterium]